ncbi:predicted protein, partial [Naegleria gruberi]
MSRSFHYDDALSNGSDNNLRDIELADDSKYVLPKKTKWSRNKKICVGSLLGCGLCCLITCIVIAIAIAIYLGRKNVNIYPTPEYTASDDFLRFLVVGDMGRADDGQKAVAASMGKF